MTRQQLIDAALYHYSMHGYQGATMRKIADEVGIKPASIYFFYKNKEELFTAAFEQLLDNHFNEMKRIHQKHAEEPVDQIFSALFYGIAAYHTKDLQGTNAYISLLTSPIPEIKVHLQKHMEKFACWLGDTLEEALMKDYPGLSATGIDKMIKQFVLLANGVLWGINHFEGEAYKEQAQLAEKMMTLLIKQLELQKL